MYIYICIYIYIYVTICIIVYIYIYILDTSCIYKLVLFSVCFARTGEVFMHSCVGQQTCDAHSTSLRPFRPSMRVQAGSGY